jgi:ribosomal protein S18 acetylase RimI-like enzyme
MNRALTIASPEEPRVRLRTAGPKDLDELRLWKNANKSGFFHKGEINALMQKAWFAGYLKRKDDFMFIVEHEGKKAGCMGFRMEKGRADVYNVIAAPGAKGKGLMTAAMRVLCSYIGAHHTKNIGCVVLKGNAALNYYDRCGFWISGSAADHDVMTLNWSKFKPVEVIAS